MRKEDIDALRNIESQIDSELAEYTALTKQSVSDWILDTFGKRCEDLHRECWKCQKWAAFDQLFEGLE